jgi:heptaprenyl diphosphate synthase
MKELAANIRSLNDFLKSYLTCEARIFGEALLSMLDAGGKRLRPALIFVCARLCSPDIEGKSLLPLAAAAEIIHMASLVHDDIIDKSPLRRGHASVYARYGGERALKCGDYLLAKALLLAVEYSGENGIRENASLNTKNMNTLSFLADTAKNMCAGEFLQLKCGFSLKAQGEDNYYESIRNKTAAFFGVCCQAGAMAGGGGQEETAALKAYGEYFGMAFQIEDDIADFLGGDACGKPKGQDLRQGVFTLPLIYALKEGNKAFIKLITKKEKTAADIENITAFIEKKGGFLYAENKARAFALKAANALNALAGGEARDYLRNLALKKQNAETGGVIL